MAESSCKQISAGLEVPALSGARSPATSARRRVPFGEHVASRALPYLRARCLLAARHRGTRAHPGTLRRAPLLRTRNFVAPYSGATVASNHSIERTAKSQLRWLSSAAHVER